MEKRTAIVLGLGEIGQPIYKMLANAYGNDEVRGWDLDKSLNADLGISRVVDDQTFTFMHVCYPQLPGFVDSVWQYKDLYEPSYIIVHSTVSPGILGKVQQTVGIDTKVYYSPVRGNQKDGMEQCLHSYTKYLASVMPLPSGVTGSHLEGAGFTVKYVHGLDGLVWAKLLDLAWYGLNIAFYQELERIVPDILDYEIVKDFISSTPKENEGKVRREVFYGGFIGGHCVTQAIEKILAERGDMPMLRAVLDSNIKRFVELAHKKPPHHP